MYGHIHVILKDLVLSVARPSAWEQILKEAGLVTSGQEAQALDTVVQSDDLTLALVGATCRVLQMGLDDALHAFGKHFVCFILRSGHAMFLKSHGTTLAAFLQNINNIHTYLERDHPNARFPFFEATYDPVEDVAYLTYLSTRQGLRSLVVGLVEEIGVRLYGLNVTLEEAALPDDLAVAGAASHAAAWRVSWAPRPGGPAPLEAAAAGACEPRAKKISFPALHSVMIDIFRVVRKADKLGGCFSRSAAKRVAQPRLGRPRRRGHLEDDDSDDSDTSAMVKTISMRKLSEVEDPDGRPLECILLRATRAGNVAAAWSDVTLPQCRAFWRHSEGRARDYGLSEDVRDVDVLVSHSWSPPENWGIVMGSEICYADIKSTMLAVMAKDVALLNRQDLDKWAQVTFWVDKACIPQDQAMLKQSCINLIEKFIKRCDRVCVLFTWSYLERLWCVFEWACVLMDKEPDKLWLQTEMFVTEQSFPLYVDCIRNFSLRRTKCFLDGDRAVLAAKIDECYASHKDFERLVRATATALMARSMAFRAGRSARLRAQFFEPWVDLAKDLGFDELAAKLASCRPSEWRARAAVTPNWQQETLDRDVAEAPVLLGRRVVGNSVSASKYHAQIEGWFNEAVSPVLHRLRAEVAKVREE